MSESGSPRTRTWVALAAVVLGAAFAQTLWLLWTGGDVPIHEDIPPRHYSLLVSGLLGVVVALACYHGARKLLQGRGRWPD